ncbi:MAG: hypothetical protein LBM78_01160 [Clostridiales bacterium]|jgi:beta-N-acetylhexosaminidase|nr:hypothetical protein [Clostridiales bacterium]
MTEQQLVALVDSMSVEQLCGQVLVPHLGVNTPPEEIEAMLKRVQPGGIFMNNHTPERMRLYTEIANKYCVAPCCVAGDIEGSLGGAVAGETNVPRAMAWGACDDPKLIEKLGRQIAVRARRLGFHWTFAPVVDLNMNPNNPITGCRAISDDAATVARIAGAWVKGMRRGGLMAVACKHFPGDGTDDRNQHFLTSVNSLSYPRWLRTYGRVYKKMFALGADSVMVAHIALPSYTGENAAYGALSGSLNPKLMVDLLRGELGFTGLIVSDAMSMIGAAAAVPIERLSIEFFKAGGDVVLFPERHDKERLIAAVTSGEIPPERLKASVLRFLRMKNALRLFENQEEIVKKLPRAADVPAIAQEIAERSIKFVRDTAGILPLKLTPGAKILMINQFPSVNMLGKAQQGGDKPFVLLKAELEARGYAVFAHNLPTYEQIQVIMQEKYDCVLINLRFDPMNYHGGSLRLSWEHVIAFWRAYALQNPLTVLTSFGDPYKLYEFPYIKTYVNAFDACDASVKAFVRVLLGEIPARAKNPVTLKGFFNRGE